MKGLGHEAHVLADARRARGPDGHGRARHAACRRAAAQVLLLAEINLQSELVGGGLRPELVAGAGVGYHLVGLPDNAIKESSFIWKGSPKRTPRATPATAIGAST